MVRTRIDALDRDISLIVAEELSPEAQSRQVAAMARQLRDEAVATNRALTGEEPTWTTRRMQRPCGSPAGRWPMAPAFRM